MQTRPIRDDRTELNGSVYLKTHQTPTRAECKVSHDDDVLLAADWYSVDKLLDGP